MTRIEDANPRDRSGSYDRLFGIPALGKLISKVQSAVISSGTGLEKMIADRVMPIKDIDALLNLMSCKKDAEANVHYFLSELVKINVVRSRLKSLLGRRKGDGGHQGDQAST